MERGTASVLHKNTLQCPLPELKPRLLDLEMIATNHEAIMTNKLIQNALTFFKGTRMNRQFGMFFCYTHRRNNKKGLQSLQHIMGIVEHVSSGINNKAHSK